ncbi:MAG TPA: hypothetical protein VL551_05065 [Actinospica sp.]|nr:hypothetical protein [Actinospica sp.]
MGKGARWITRCSTALVLVGTVSSAASTAFAYSSGGVNVPDATFRQGTGTQQVSISVGAPLVGTDQALVVWPFYFSDYHWLVGVEADPDTGATCAYDVGQWQCTPGRSGWHAGDLRVLVSTAKAMDCGLHAGVCQTDEINIQGLPDAPDHSGLPDGKPFSVLGNVLIMPETVPWHGPTPSTQPVYRPLTATTAPAAQSVTATTAPAGPDTASADPTTSVDAVNTSLSGGSHGSPVGLVLLVALPVVGGVGGFTGYRMRRRRRPAGGE